MRFILLLLAISGCGWLFGNSVQYCIFRGSECEAGSEGCIPGIRNISDPEDIKPTITDLPDDLKGVCPDYDGTENCCDRNTMRDLKTNLIKVDITFGNPNSGCSLCAANIKRFWCKYNCDPNQSDFIIPGSSFAMNYTRNPEDPSSVLQIVTSNITLDIKTTCGIFQSCQNVDFTKALGSMNTYQGLFNTFSSQAVSTGNVLMNFTYVSNSTAMTVPVNNCSMIFGNGTDQYNYTLYGQGWCNCQHCAQNCTPRSDWDLYIKQNSIVEGLTMRNVITAGIVAAVLTILGLSLRVISQKNKKEEEGVVADDDGYSSAK